RRRPDDCHPPDGLARELRRRSDRLDRSAGNAGRADPPALPLDVWHAAIFLEAQQHIVQAKIRNSWMDRAAEHFHFSAGPAAHLSNHRPDVSRLGGAVGACTIAHRTNAAVVDYGRRGTLRIVLSWISADRRIHVYCGIHTGEG